MLGIMKILGLWKPKPKAYYFKMGPGGYYETAYVVERHHKDGEEWIHLKNAVGQTVFYWPISKLEADPISDNRIQPKPGTQP
jgi:hypothetical protein